MPTMNRQVVLKERPTGIPGPEHFEIVERPVPVPRDGQLLVPACLAGRSTQSLTHRPFSGRSRTVSCPSPTLPGRISPRRCNRLPRGRFRNRVGSGLFRGRRCVFRQYGRSDHRRGPASAARRWACGHLRHGVDFNLGSSAAGAKSRTASPGQTRQDARFPRRRLH
jgi:hypothetical protein